MQPTKLPIGIQDFEKLRTGDFIYVDKTKYLVDMIRTGSVYFLSRPRRFGKSLTISTFDALFSGKKELFKGLYVEQFLNEPDFAPAPVIRLDMSKTITNRGLEELECSMLAQVKNNADRYEIEIESEIPGVALDRLIKAMSKRHGKIVFLVDEYDKPILDCINEPEKAQEFRASLRNFYTQIKASDAETRFVFFTGISKFTKTGVFSAMNNLYDLSIDPKFSCMLGYTKDEMAIFSPRIAEIADEIGCSFDELSARIKDYYNGFSFDGKNFVYNPFSMLNFLKLGEFRNFWFTSGSPSFIIDYIRENRISVEDYRGYVVMEDFADMNEIERAEPASFLFQAGYLTFKERFGDGYVLDYPNLEVLSATASLVASYNFGLKENFGGFGLYLKRAFDMEDIEEIVACLNRLLAAIPYSLFEETEKFYHSVLLVVMWGAGINTVAEIQTHRGRSDIVATHEGTNYVIELKIAEGEDGAKKAARVALDQIEQKGYALKYPNATRLGFGIDVKSRQIYAELK